MNTVSYLLTLIIWCNELLPFIILNSLFTDSLHCPSVFTHEFIQLFVNVMNRIKIIKQVWLGLYSTVKSTFPLALPVQFCVMNNFEELQHLPVMEFSFNTLPRQTLIASLLKSVSDSTTDAFFFGQKELFSWTYLLKKIARRTKILISPVWKKKLTLFELMQIEVPCNKNYFKIFYHKRQGLLEIT